ncbi:MAG: hypothetical protein J2P25_11320 [Nocardiopsaceae bacterium]|nr:hypothetical protein [Nocardiopsaceae bacterium]
MEHETLSRAASAGHSRNTGKAVPGWWAYARQFPHWYVWRGVAGDYYGRIPGLSPQRVVRAQDPEGLRDMIAGAELERHGGLSSRLGSHCA